MGAPAARRVDRAVLYFDHNATSPLSPAAREAWLEAAARFPGNASSPHRLGARAEAALEQARAQLAALLHCSPDELIWTSGATESSNAVLHHGAAASAGEVWFSAIEHPCVLAAARVYFPNRARELPVDADGVVAVESLAKELLSTHPALVAVMAANNETGVLQPWQEVRALCRERDVPFFCDAAQWIGKLPAADLGACTFVSGCAHKFGGPPGVGFLKVPSSFRALLVGGPQEQGRRAGTENLPGVLAMLAALEERERALTSAALAAKYALQADFENRVRTEIGARVLGGAVPRLWNTTSAVLPPLPDARQRWVVKLDKLGFAVSTGSACASGKEQISHVLAAMDCAPHEASRVLRFSSGWETTAADWDALLAGLQRALDGAS